MHTMPKEIEYVADKILKNKPLYDEIKKLLMDIVRKLNNDSLSHSSFCNALKTPHGVDKKLLKIFGISDRQMIASFAHIGFHPDSRMYSSLYYQTLSLVYYIGVRSDDDLLRILAVSLIYVKIFNGRQYRIMPNGCQEEIAQYLIQNVFRKSHTFKKYPNPFVAITQYFAPTLDDKYFSYVSKDPAHPTLGLVVILMQSYGRMFQVFMGIKDHYYKAHNDGNKITVDTVNTNFGGKEVDGSNTTSSSNTAHKLQKNLVFKNPKLSTIDIKYLKSDPYNISTKFIETTEKFLISDESDDDLTNVYELFFNIIKIDETKICGLNIINTVDKITGSKGNNIQIKKLKKYIDILLEQMYKGIMKSGSSSRLKLRKVLLLIIILRAKKAFCKEAKFE